MLIYKGNKVKTLPGVSTMWCSSYHLEESDSKRDAPHFIPELYIKYKVKQ